MLKRLDNLLNTFREGDTIRFKATRAPCPEGIWCQRLHNSGKASYMHPQPGMVSWIRTVREDGGFEILHADGRVSGWGAREVYDFWEKI